MGCLVEVLESSFDVRFTCKKTDQKVILEFLLTYSKYDLKELAELLNVSTYLLNKVLNGKDYLPSSAALNMMEWLYIFISPYP